MTDDHLPDDHPDPDPSEVDDHADPDPSEVDDHADPDPSEIDEHADPDPSEIDEAARVSGARALDERLSALFDGELRLGEQRPDLDDPRLARRAAELTTAAEHVGAPVPPPADDIIDQQIERALAALPVSTASTTASPEVAMLRPHRWARRLPALGAAAALVMVAAIGVTVAGGDRDGDDTAIDDATEAAEFFSGDDSAVATSRGAATVDAAEPEAATAEAADLADVEESSDADDTTEAAGAEESSAVDSPSLDGGRNESNDEDGREANDLTATTVMAGAGTDGDDTDVVLPGEPVELSEACRAEVVSSVDAVSMEGASIRNDGAVVVLVRFDDGSVATAVVVVESCGVDGVDLIVDLDRP